jgi:hypothetical protein
VIATAALLPRHDFVDITTGERLVAVNASVRLLSLAAITGVVIVRVVAEFLSRNYIAASAWLMGFAVLSVTVGVVLFVRRRSALSGRRRLMSEYPDAVVAAIRPSLDFARKAARLRPDTARDGPINSVCFMVVSSSRMTILTESTATMIELMAFQRDEISTVETDGSENRVGIAFRVKTTDTEGVLRFFLLDEHWWDAVALGPGLARRLTYRVREMLHVPG